MILKVHQHLTGKWFLYDNIVLAKIQQDVDAPDKPYAQEDFINLLPDPLPSGCYAASVDLIFKDGSAKTVLCQIGWGYLMNDDGKTIERL